MKHKKKLQKILDSQALDQLEPFRSPQAWEPLDKDDKALLALLFVKQGEAQLREDYKKALESFEIASNISQNDPMILFSQGETLAFWISNETYLEEACKIFQRVVNALPTFFDGWCCWAVTLMRLGLLRDETTYYQDAHHKFVEALAVGADQPPDVLAQFYWQWGVCWFGLGNLSGEAVDFRASIEKYQKAAACGLDDPHFWSDYGHSLIDLGCLVGRQELFLEAIDCYKKTVGMDPRYFDAWLNLGCAYHKLFIMTNQEEHYRSASLSFQKASELESDSPVLWLRWAQVNTLAGKITRDVEKLRLAIHYYEKADHCHPNEAQILLGWGETLLLWGTHLEDLNLLKQAEEKFSRTIDLIPDNVEVWYLYGSCLNELGRYFGEEQYYYKAIEKFHQGLSLNRNDPLLWYGLALAHYAIGDQRHDEVMVEKAVRYCTRVIEFGGHGMPQFWNDWGVALMKLGEMTNNPTHIEAALDKFEHALSEYHDDPSGAGVDPEWLYNYGCALDFLGDFNEDPNYYEKAIQVLEKVLEIEPGYVHARYNLALSLSHLAELTADVECFQKSLEHFQVLVSNDREDEMGWNDWGLTLLNYAQLINDMARPEEGQKIYEMAEGKLLHAVALGSTQAFYTLACLYSLTGNYPSAMHYLERAKEANNLPPLEDVMHDEWLDGLRRTQAFRNFITQLTK